VRVTGLTGLGKRKGDAGKLLGHTSERLHDATWLMREDSFEVTIGMKGETDGIVENTSDGSF